MKQHKDHPLFTLPPEDYTGPRGLALLDVMTTSCNFTVDVTLKLLVQVWPWLAKGTFGNMLAYWYA